MRQLSLVILLLATSAFAASPYLVKDITTTGANGSSLSDGFTLFQGLAYFAADDGLHGRELWKTDGTVAGTKLALDLDPGTGSSNPHFLIASSNALYFFANSGNKNILYSFDGASVHTVFDQANFYPNSGFVIAGDRMFFVAEDDTHGLELWTTDGATTGSHMVKDIAPGVDSSEVNSMVAFNNELYFVAYAPNQNTQLWKSDGTEAGTIMVTDKQGVNFGVVSSLSVCASTLYFTAIDNPHGGELWKSDGTSAGTSIVRDILRGQASAAFYSIGCFNNRAYFSANDGLHGTELWVTDGTTQGTRMVVDINPGAESSTPRDFVTGANGLYFSADDGKHGDEPWITNGTPQGTYLIKDMLPGFDSSYLSYLCRVNNLIYFVYGDSRLWRTDGSAAGTYSLREGVSYITPAAINGLLYFGALDLHTGIEPWKSDGTVAGTKLVKDIFGGNAGSAIYSMVSLNGKVYFSLYTQTGTALWRSDGTSAGTIPVTSIQGLNLKTIAERIWISDQGTLSVFDDQSNQATVLKQFGPYYPGGFVAIGNTVFFRVAHQLWRTDGTPSGTVLVRNFGTKGLGSFFVLGGRLYFPGYDPEHGVELWSSDGSTSGTVLFKDIKTGNRDSNPAYFHPFGKGFLFSADDGTHGREVWFSDGTAAGTNLWKDVNPGIGGSHPSNFVMGNGKLFFTAESDATGRELWVSSGTPDSVMVLDVTPGNTGSSPDNLIPSSNGVLLTLKDTELWTTDGTPAGTKAIHSFQSIRPLVNLTGANRFAFAASDENSGVELWLTDGTPGGTTLLQDIWPGVYSSAPSNLIALNGTLFFLASDRPHGRELWAFHFAP